MLSFFILFFYCFKLIFGNNTQSVIAKTKIMFSFVGLGGKIDILCVKNAH